MRISPINHEVEFKVSFGDAITTIEPYFQQLKLHCFSKDNLAL